MLWGLGALFGAIYFIQGIAEPNEGLVSQPVKSWMRRENATMEQIGQFAFIIGLPWMIKPLWGLLADLIPVPFLGRRRGVLLLASAVSMAVLGYVYLYPPEPGLVHTLLPWLFVVCVGVAMSDVVADALMIEKGQPHGITGTLQSIQWTAMYAATILTTSLGGYLSEYGLQQQAFAICAGFMSLTFLLALVFVREERREQPSRRIVTAVSELGRSAVNPWIVAMVAYLFLWAFNPFSNAVLQVYVTEDLELSQQFYGSNMGSVLAIGSMVGSAAYGFYCRRVPFAWLVHLSIIAGVAATIAYWGLVGPKSAMVISFFVGFTYMTGTLIQFDLAARICPAAVAATVFALLMSVSNAGLDAATWCGGALYDLWKPQLGATAAFNLLVAIGAMATAASWGLVPILNRYARTTSQANRT
jgi:MFS family permease